MTNQESPDEAANRLALAVQSNYLNPRTAAQLLNQLMDLGPAHATKAHVALLALQGTWRKQGWGTCLGVFRRPLSGVEDVFARDVVREALRSLRVDPARFLPHRTDEWIMRREERVVDELLTGTAEQRAQLADTLTRLADDVELAPILRYRAAAALGRVDEALGAAAEERLRAAGVADPGEPAPNPQTIAKVERAWQRIEDAMKERAPHLLKELGPPLPPEDVAVCRQIFGIPDAFAACLARHRYAHLFPDELDYEDVRKMLDGVDEEWWYNHGDFGDLPDLADDDTWLGRLRLYAEHVEALTA